MKADIVFISYNRKSEVQFNLKKMTNYKRLNKIIWVDNGSTDEAENIQFDKEKVNFIKLPNNIGISAWNVGVKQSNADIIILLDDDSHIEEEAIDITINKFEEDELLGALAFKIILPSTGENVTIDWKAGPATHFWGCGAAVRKSVWDKLGGLKEQLFIYAHEYDYCIRVWNENYKVLFTPEITAFHRVSSMNRSPARLVSYSVRNNFIFIKTYFDKKYQSKLFFYDRLTWFIRSLLAGSSKAFFAGLRMIKEIENNIEAYPIQPSIQQFYINNLRIFEPPLKKVVRKKKYGLLFKVSREV